MKKEFIGFYNPTVNEINDAWTKGVFAFDANTLLNLYRYTEQTRNDFLGALKTINDKLFLPYQAALEFHTNRIGVIDGIESSYASLKSIIENNYEKNLEPQINIFKKHPSILVDNISKLHAEFLKKVSIELEKQKKNHPDFKNQDIILDELTLLFENSIGKEYTKEELKKIYEEGKERFAESIPPGYKDLETKRKKGERHIYGDLIIWKELINYTKREKKPIIFVTDDRKEDWWTIENGKTLRPREELIKEFFDLTEIRILIYNADNFLHFAKKKKLIPQLKDKTIKEVKEIGISDLLASRSYLNNMPKTFNDYLTSEAYIANKPLTISELINNHANLSGDNKSSIYELLTNHAYQVNNSSIISDLITNQTYLESNPLIISDIISKQDKLKDKPYSSAVDIKEEDKNISDKSEKDNK